MYLHGPYAKFHDGPIEVFAETVAEAVKMVTSLVKGFAPSPRSGRKRIQVAGCNTLESLVERGGGPEEIHIFPQFNGGKRGGFVQILIGAVLIAASFLLPGSLSFLAPILLNIGISLVLGGILQLLSAPQRDRDNQKSRYLGTPPNTVEIGTRIPILYGEDLVGGHFLSVNISAVDGVL